MIDPILLLCTVAIIPLTFEEVQKKIVAEGLLENDTYPLFIIFKQISYNMRG